MQLCGINPSPESNQAVDWNELIGKNAAHKIHIMSSLLIQESTETDWVQTAITTNMLVAYLSGLIKAIEERRFLDQNQETIPLATVREELIQVFQDLVDVMTITTNRLYSSVISEPTEEETEILLEKGYLEAINSQPIAIVQLYLREIYDMTAIIGNAFNSPPFHAN